VISSYRCAVITAVQFRQLGDSLWIESKQYFQGQGTSCRLYWSVG